MKRVEKIMNFWGLYYPIILAFISFLFSVSLWFTGNELEGIFVGIWVPSILSASVAIRQRRSITFKTDKYFFATELSRSYNHTIRLPFWWAQKRMLN